MKKLLVFLFCFILSFSCLVTPYVSYAANGVSSASPEISVPSAVLMEAGSGKILFEKNAEEKRHPASVTKIMTLLLVFEAIDEGKIKITDTVSVSERAAEMGGSQIFLEVGEEMSVDDLIKSVTVCSANDAAVALAEFVSGSEEAFVARMNERAAELGMKNTHFENTNGLDDTTDTHLTSARDIAIMSRELLSHKKIFDYTTIWQDTVRNGAFTLTNTNKLVRFYKGANGLKTGFTSKSGYCISACAERDGMQLIAVIMGAESSDIRNVNAKKLLDFGFANYRCVSFPTAQCGEIEVISGERDKVKIGYNAYSDVLLKEMAGKLRYEMTVDKSVKAPVEKGRVVGKVIYKIGDETVAEREIYVLESVGKVNFIKIFTDFLKKYFLF